MGSDGNNRFLADRAEFADPQVRATAAALAMVRAQFSNAGAELRADAGREWEYAWVLAALARLAAAGVPSRILDIGGGNSPLCHLLGERGHAVTVLDPDQAVVRAIADHACRLGAGARLAAATPHHGQWPFVDDSFDVAVCVSVFEGILRRDRPLFWREIRRCLRPGGSLLLTCDYGTDARWLGDPPASLADIAADIVDASGLTLAGPLPTEPQFLPANPPPIQAAVLGVDGEQVSVAYTFVALHLRRLIR